jgi:hypothetical protein
VLLWNVDHDWAMFRHEQGHVLPTTEISSWRDNLLDFVEFVGGQLLALSPLVTVALIYTLARLPQADEQRLLWALSLAVLGFFTFKALFGKVQLNWPAPAYIGLLVLFAGRIDDLNARWRRVVAIGMISSVALLSVALFPRLIGLSPTKAPFRDLRLWQTPIAAVAQQTQTDPVKFLLVPSYHLAGIAGFYWPQRLPVYPVAENRRFSQHHFWPGLEREAGRDGVYLATAATLPWRVRDAFAECRELSPVAAVAADGKTLRTLYAWRCAGYRPVDWPAPTTY